MASLVRVQEIEINNFKNVEKGVATFQSFKYLKNPEKCIGADILGVYGQNGSGKTSLVEAMDIFKSMLSGEELDNSIVYLLKYGEDKTDFKYTFLIERLGERFKVLYEFGLEKTEKSFKVYKESIRYSKIDSDNRMSLKTLINYDSDNDNNSIIKPMSLLNRLDNKKTDLVVSKEFSLENRTSFIFSKRTMKIIYESLKEESIEYRIIDALSNFAKLDLFVIRNNYLGHINLNHFMPFSFMLRNNESMTKGTLSVALFKPSTISKKMFHLLERVTNQINIVLESLVPGLNLGIKKISEELMENSEPGIKVELLSLRGNAEIPLKYESDGIKKIISILSALIAMYNNTKVCLIIDELDAGVFEFLLGEILSVLKENAGGQLIFTSHNLRALEVLDKNDIMFTTTNPKNRYIRLKNIKNTNNLRDVYLREIFLGGQGEELYKKTKGYAINRAFRKAGIENE